MATNTDTHISRVILDTKEAKDKLKELQKKLEDVKKAKEEAYAKGDHIRTYRQWPKHSIESLKVALLSVIPRNGKSFRDN